MGIGRLKRRAGTGCRIQDISEKAGLRVGAESCPGG